MEINEWKDFLHSYYRTGEFFENDESRVFLSSVREVHYKSSKSVESEYDFWLSAMATHYANLEKEELLELRKNEAIAKQESWIKFMTKKR